MYIRHFVKICSSEKRSMKRMSTFANVCQGSASFVKAHSRNSFRWKFIIAFCLSDSENNFGARHNFDERGFRSVLYSQ